VTGVLRALAAACALAALAPWGAAAAEVAPADAVALLRGGGYVLYFRHAATDFTQNDVQMASFEDCGNQRNLTEQGRQHARDIGAAIRSLGVPIGQVRASPYCRTVETALLAFGRAEKTQAVRGGPARPEDPERYAALRRLLGQRPAGNLNDVIVSHGNPFIAVAGPPYLAAGEAAIVEPAGGGFRVVARIKAGEWPAAR
jgi:phosphohistidine phosphatase SixA